jgi:hypothetical protein
MISSGSAGFGICLSLAHHHRDNNNPPSTFNATIHTSVSATTQQVALVTLKRSSTRRNSTTPFEYHPTSDSQRRNKTTISLQQHNCSLTKYFTVTGTAAMANIDEISVATSNLSLDTEQAVTRAATAAAQVGSVPELLEGIFSHLPVLDLVMATGVNKTFRNVVQASPQLQQKLFMSPSEDKAEYWKIVRPTFDKYERGYSYNTIHLHRMESPGVDDVVLKAQLDAVAADPDYWNHPTRFLKVVSICPLLELSHPACRSQGDLGLSSMNGAFELQLRVKPRAVRAKEPWENMFITSPPCQEVCMHLVWEGRVAGKLDKRFDVWNQTRCEQGITLAFLVDRVATSVSAVRIWTRNDDAEEEEAGNWHVVKDTTLQDQVTIYKNGNSESVCRMSTDSLIQLYSLVAPTESAYEEMATHGHVATCSQ